MIIEALKTLSYNRLTNVGCVLFGTLLAPFMFIFQYASHIYNVSSFVPLLFISICVGLPVSLVIFILQVLDQASIDPSDPKEKLATRFRQMGSSSIMAGFGLYLPCCIKFFIPKQTLPEAIWFMAFFYFTIVVNLLISIFMGNTKKVHEALLKKSEELKLKKKTDRGPKEN